MRRSLTLVFLLLAAGAVGTSASTGGQSTLKERLAAKNGLIAFMRPGKVGEYDLWVVRPSGKGLRPLTTAPSARSDYNPDWSPDGSSVLFERRVLDGTGDNLYVVNANDRQLRRITNCAETALCWSDNEAKWSPDGERIAFGRATGPPSEQGPSKVAIYLAHADGTGISQLSNPPSGFGDHYPTWSADGKTVVFQRDPAQGRTTLIAVDVAAQAERVIYRLPRWAAGGGIPKFSPNGKRILFSFWCIYGDDCAASTRSARNAQIATIRPDGTMLRRLRLRVRADSGSWSPDGKKIVFRCHLPTTFRLCTATLNGRHLKRFPGRVDSAEPDWGTH